MITVDAPESGPSSEQQTYFQHLTNALSELEHKAKDFVRTADSGQPDIEQLSVYSIEIGTDSDVESERFVIELADDDAILIHRVSFESGTPIHYTYDD